MSNDKPSNEPIGLLVARIAKSLNRAFEAELAEAGGSIPTWLVLLSLKSGRWETQRELAEAVGIRGATLTHHLDGMERAGLVARSRDLANRRIQRVELTPEGHAAFDRLRKVAMTFDRRLRRAIPEADLAQARSVLAQLAANAHSQ